jgi:integrase
MTAITTTKQLQALKPKASHYVKSIGGPGMIGIAVKVFPSGAKEFRYRHRYTNDEGKTSTEWVPLGTFANHDMSLTDIPAAAAKVREILKEHRTYREYEQALRAVRDAETVAESADDRRHRFTLKNLVADYVDAISNPKTAHYLKSYREVQRALEKYIVPDMGDKPVQDVRRVDVKAALQDLEDRGKHIQRNRALAYLSRVYSWGFDETKFDELEEEGIEVRNPCVNLKKAAEDSRERALDDVEIRNLLKNLPDSGIRDDIADVYRLILLLAARPGEVCRIRFDQIKDAEIVTGRDANGQDITQQLKVLELPETKKGTTLVQPLCEQVLDIIERRRKASSSEYLFPAPADPKRHLREDALSKPLKDALPKLKTLPFRPHDLRGTAVTAMSNVVDDNGQKISQFLKARILNHKDSSVTGRYDRYGYLSEKAHWLKLWGERLDRLTGANVATLKSKAGE